MVEEKSEMRSFEEYFQANKGTMDAVSIEASWLALKGACTTKKIENGVRIDAVTERYPMYNAIIAKHTWEYKLSTDDRDAKWKDLAKYAKMKLGKGL